MNAMSFITQRRSVRRYKPDPVPEEVLEQLLTAAVSAPTGGNMQPWEFVIVADGAAREAVVATTYSGYYSGPGNPQAWLQEAPLLIVVCCNFKGPGPAMGRLGKNGLPWMWRQPFRTFCWPATAWAWAPAGWGASIRKAWQISSSYPRG